MEILLCEDKEIKNVAKAIVKYITLNNLKKILLVANDGNIKCNYLLSIIQTVLLKNGIEIHNLDACTYPCLTYVQNKNSYPLSLMLGVDTINNKVEIAINSLKQNFKLKSFLSLLNKTIKLKNNHFCKIKNIENLKKEYFNYLKLHISFNLPISIDNSYPAINELCNFVFPKHQKVNNSHLLKHISLKQQKIGISFNKYGTENTMFMPNNIKNETQKHTIINDAVLSAIITLNKIQLRKD